MTRPEIRTKIERLELKVEAALDRGHVGREHHYLDEIEELEGTLSVMCGGEE